jgi:hypothetical protein
VSAVSEIFNEQERLTILRIVGVALRREWGEAVATTAVRAEVVQDACVMMELSLILWGERQSE